MSELENKAEETPKRKRRTKEEMAVARAEGKLPSKRTKKSNTLAVKVEEQQAPGEPIQRNTAPISKEQSVLIMSCLNPILSQITCNAAKDLGVEVVLLEDKVIHDYLNAKEDAAERDNLKEFLSDTANRLQCERHVAKLWSILTDNAPVEHSNERIFTCAQLCKKTNLTHSSAHKALNALHVFGLLEFTKGNYEFRLIFNNPGRRNIVKTEILNACKSINYEIMRFKSLVDSDNDLNREDARIEYEKLQELINQTIEF